MGAFSTVFIKHLHVLQCKILIGSGSLDFTEGVFQVLHNNFAATLATLDLIIFGSFDTKQLQIVFSRKIKMTQRR